MSPQKKSEERRPEPGIEDGELMEPMEKEAVQSEGGHGKKRKSEGEEEVRDERTRVGMEEVPVPDTPHSTVTYQTDKEEENDEDMFLPPAAEIGGLKRSRDPEGDEGDEHRGDPDVPVEENLVGKLGSDETLKHQQWLDNLTNRVLRERQEEKDRRPGQFDV